MPGEVGLETKCRSPGFDTSPGYHVIDYPSLWGRHWGRNGLPDLRQSSVQRLERFSAPPRSTHHSHLSQGSRNREHALLRISAVLAETGEYIKRQDFLCSLSNRSSEYLNYFLLYWHAILVLWPYYLFSRTPDQLLNPKGFHEFSVCAATSMICLINTTSGLDLENFWT